MYGTFTFVNVMFGFSTTGAYRDFDSQGGTLVKIKSVNMEPYRVRQRGNCTVGWTPDNNQTCYEKHGTKAAQMCKPCARGKAQVGRMTGVCKDCMQISGIDFGVRLAGRSTAGTRNHHDGLVLLRDMCHRPALYQCFLGWMARQAGPQIEGRDSARPQNSLVRLLVKSRERERERVCVCVSECACLTLIYTDTCAHVGFIST